MNPLGYYMLIGLLICVGAVLFAMALGVVGMAHLIGRMLRRDDPTTIKE